MPLRRNRAILVLVAVSIVTIALCVLFFLRGGNAKWATMTGRVAQLKQEAKSRSLPRSVLRGQAQPGNAWDEYNLAIADALTFEEDRNGTALMQYIATNSPNDRAKAIQLISKHPAILEHLRLGAQRADGQYPYHWELGSEMELPSLLGSRIVAATAVSQARISLESGRPQEAADLLLDVSVFARDIGTNGALLTSLIGDSLYMMAFDELRNVILSGKLTRAQLTDLGKKLELVDRDFPALGPTLANESLATSVATMESTERPSTWWFVARHGGWRYGFSSQQMALAALEERESYAERAQKFDQLDFASAQKEAEIISAEAETSENPLIQMAAVPSLTKIVVKHRESLARLRLLRAGTGFLLDGKVPTLADPFGANLPHADETGKIKIWSFGTNGTNENGVGGWTFAPSQLDIVLEIKRN